MVRLRRQLNAVLRAEMALLLHSISAGHAMELIALVMIVLFSAGLALAAARATLWAVFVMMMRPSMLSGPAAGTRPGPGRS